MNAHSVTRVVLLFAAVAAGCSDPADILDTPDAACGAEVFYPDTDGDGFGDSSVESCTPQTGYVAKGGDCRDNDPASHPMATEVCDTIDNNCDGKIDDADPALSTTGAPVFYRDADGDGFGSTTTMRACSQPAGYATTSTDCDDTLASVNPSAAEVCDSRDNDCDSLIDTADSDIDLSTAMAFYRDADADTYGAGTAMMACSKPTGYVAQAGDCNDLDNLSKPGGTELCDGADNDCDGGIDGTAALPNRCAALVGTYAGTYSHQAQEKLGTTVVNSMTCNGTGSGSLVLNRRPGVQGTFSCTYSGGLGLFTSSQQVTLRADVALNGAVTGTIEHRYDSSSLKRTYNVTGTQTGTTMTLTGTGSFYPHPMSAVPWQVTFNFAATK